MPEPIPYGPQQPIIPPPGLSVPARPRVGAPVVASGNAAPPAGPPPSAPFQPVAFERTPPGQEADPEMVQRSRLSDFFFGMANSQSPSFFGAIGAGGQAMNAADRQRRSEGRDDRRLSAEENYRAAQIETQNAQLALEANPESPANLARAAAARAQEMTARAHMMTAQRGPQAQTALVESEGPDGQRTPGILNMQTGQISPLPSGVITPQAQQRQDELFRRIRQEAAGIADRSVTARMRSDPMFAMDPHAQENLRQTITDNEMRAQMQLLQSRGRPTPATAAPAAPVPTGGAYDIRGNPITR